MPKVFAVQTKEGIILRRYEVWHLPDKLSGTTIAENPAAAARQCGWKLEECEVKSVPFYLAQIEDCKPIKAEEPVK